MKRGNQNGFSLVELIVVIAIMGVLMVILAPQYLKYVEKSRLQRDNTAIGEIAESIKAACSNADVATWIQTQPKPIKIGFTGGAGENKTLLLSSTSSNEVEKELVKIVESGWHTSSGSYQMSGDAVVINIDIDAGAFMVTVDGFIGEPGGTATTRQY